MTRPIACLAGAALVAVALTGSARATVYESEINVIPNPNEVDVSRNAVDFVGTSGTFTVPYFRMSNFSGGIFPPDVGQSASSFFDVFIELELQGSKYSGVGSGQLDITGLSSSVDPFGVTTSSYDVRMSGLTVTVQAPTGEIVEIRESPSGGGGGHGGGGGGGGGTTSSGPHLRESPSLAFFEPVSFAAANPSTYYTINSFFDIFTELSLDGGQTWLPASGPMHLESVPEPSAFVLGITGLAGLSLAILRRTVRRS